jgi:tRNA A-37 threonylcarbamoyl transferase component Bud32
MAIVEVNPRYRDLLQRLGLIQAEQFLALSGVIVSGHPDRHVLRVTLEIDGACLTAYMKREHRRAWRDRLANAWAGFGFISKARREARMLQALRRAGIGCPEWIAAGEDDRGRAFLLLEALTEAWDLRTLLREPFPARRRFAQVLGEALAHLHEAGFDHPDLHAKHVFVDPETQAVHFLDCQRTRRRRRLDWQRRWHNLAVLDGTLAEHLASSADRLSCLRAYLRASLAGRAPRALLIDAARRIRRRTQRLLRYRHVREVRREPLPQGTQELIWLDGEALCVTRRFRATWCGQMPLWLGAKHLPTGRASTVVRSSVCLPEAKPATLIRRRLSQPLRWLWAWLRRRPLNAPEVRQAALLFRLERYGVGVPRLLAFGQRHPRPWQTESFLLTEAISDAMDLRQWLRDRLGPGTPPTAPQERWHLLRQAGAALRGMHDAHCYLRSGPDVGEKDFPLLVQARRDEAPVVLLRSVELVRTARRSDRSLALRDLLSLRGMVLTTACSRTDQLRFFLSYQGLARLTPTARELIRSLLAMG